MEWAVQRSLRADNPCKGVSLPRVEEVGDDMCLLTHEEFDLLHDEMSPRYRLFLRTMIGTGLRAYQAYRHSDRRAWRTIHAADAGPRTRPVALPV